MKINHKDKEIDVHYLCSECAAEIGWTWPGGHAATRHNGTCSVCGEKRNLSCWNDWLRPGQDRIRMEDWD